MGAGAVAMLCLRRFKAGMTIEASSLLAGAVVAVTAATGHAQDTALEPLPRPIGGKAVHTLKSDGPPRTHEAGRVTAGDVLVATPVRHALTGVLGLDVHRGARTVLPAGTEVFGIRVSTAVRLPTTDWARRNGVPGTVLPLNDQTVWCVVPSRPGADGKTVCLPMLGGIYRWIEADSSFYPATIGATGKSPMVDAVLVNPAPVERLPTMNLSIAFGGWTEGGAQIVSTIGAGGGARVELRRILARDADGSVILHIQGGRLRLTPVAEAPDMADLSILTPLSPTAAPAL